MPKLSIKNFGPITTGCKNNDGFIDLKQLSLFIGPQGSGKSTIAKLISLFNWLEKNLVAKNIDKEFDTPLFSQDLFAYHNMTEYITAQTELIYRGNSYEFSYKNQKLTKKQINREYIRPKILYIPSDRNFCTSIKNPGRISGLPKNSFDFLLDFTDAELALNNENFSLPINGFCFSYDNKENKAFLLDKGKTYKIEISSASSGILSALPLTLTTAYYSGFLSIRPMNKSLEQVMKIKDNAYEELQKLQSTVNEIVQFDESMPTDVLKNKSKQLKKFEKELSALATSVKSPNQIMSEVINSRLINIVEEPEQNLFPEAQADVLYFLIQCMNSGSVLGGENSLVITTHSPYIVEALNNSIYAKRLSDAGKSIGKLLSDSELVSYDAVSAYKLVDGAIEDIKDDELKQIDASYLDSCSERIRDMYSKLEDIEFSDA